MFFDLSHDFKSGMPSFPGDPIPDLKYISKIENSGFNDSLLTTGMHSGTHIDAPLHMIEFGKMISDYPVSKFSGRGKIIDCRNQKNIHASTIASVDICENDFVFFYTGFDELYKTDPLKYYSEYPEPSELLVEALIDLKVGIVGFDTPGPDHKSPFTSHIRLLKKDILIIENLNNLESVFGYNNIQIFSFPYKIFAEAAPVRVVAQVGDL